MFLLQTSFRFSHQCPFPSISVQGPACTQDNFINIRISHYAPFIYHGHLHPRFQQFWIKRCWSQHTQPWYTHIQLDSEFLTHLCWFNRWEVLQGVPLRLQEPTLFYFTDVSLTGLGASWQTRHLSGQWSPPESSQPINWLELEVMRLALLRWSLSGTTDCSSHNSTAVANKEELIPSLCSTGTLDLFHLLVQYVILLIPTHLTGAHNVTVDALSWINSHSPTEWRQSVLCLRDPPLVDMFATTENKVTSVYVSHYPDDRAWAVDALSISWDGLGHVYTFPPAPIVPKTL